MKTNLSAIDVIFRTTNELGYKGASLKIRCANLTNTTLKIQKEVTSSLKWANEAKNDQQRQRKDLQDVGNDLNDIVTPDSSRISALMVSLNQSQTKYDQMKLSLALGQLRHSRDTMANQIANKKEQVQMLKEEIEQIKELSLR